MVWGALQLPAQPSGTVY